jgi:hypothetical protein
MRLILDKMSCRKREQQLRTPLETLIFRLCLPENVMGVVEALYTFLACVCSDGGAMTGAIPRTTVSGRCNKKRTHFTEKHHLDACSMVGTVLTSLAPSCLAFAFLLLVCCCQQHSRRALG